MEKCNFSGFLGGHCCFNFLLEFLQVTYFIQANTGFKVQ